jgi:hypothetical protein
MELTDSALREYLLGFASPEAAERIEARIFEDDDLFAAVRSAEDDLFDAYARGHLTSAERARFLERFGHQADRLRFAQAFGRQSVAAHTPPAARRLWIPLAAAAAVILVAGAIFTQIEAPAPDITSRQSDAPTPGAPAPPGSPAKAPLSIALTLGTTRAPGSATAVSIPAGTPAVQVNVQLDPADVFDKYSMELRGSGDRAVWTARDLKATAAGGRLIVSAQIPADGLAAGSYELAVRGGGTDLGFLPLTVRWSP